MLYIVAGGGDVGLELAGLSHPVVACGIEVAERLGSDGERHLACLAGLEADFLKCLELLGGAGQAALDIGDVELHGLGTFARAGVGDRHRGGDGAVGTHRAGRQRRLAHLKGGIAQAVTEGKHCRYLLGVVPAVAHEDTRPQVPQFL